MKLLLLINLAITFLISFLFVLGFYRYHKDEKVKKIIYPFSSIFFAYLALFIISVLWFFDITAYTPKDFNLIYSFVLFIQTLILFRIVYLINQEKNLFYLLFAYIVTLLLAYLSSYLSLFFSLTSFFLILVLSFILIRISDSYKNAAYAGGIYACVSLILGFLLLLGFGEPFLYGTISNFFFLFFVYFFLKNICSKPLTHKESSNIIQKESNLMLFVRYFLFIIVLTNLVLISTIGIHELSHVATARIYDCESRTIVYENGNYPYSEIICDNLTGKIIISLAGVITPILLGLFLFVLGGRFIKAISFLMVGFNIIAS
ncbi:MAG TPA: hypothetical protein ENG87_04515, partial [Candidatus Pacearchaeota archaeon]|nr:hypothetical protein [Candidatus Pacearchaeota archaeon]